MTVIFIASSDAFSVPRTSRILGPLLRWFFPSASPETIGNLVVLIRKCAHAWEYALLAWLAWRVLREPFRGDTRPWFARHAWGAWLIAVAYAASDEWHQSFVPSRGAAVGDVMIDAAGATAGLALIWIIGRKRRNW
jgi:VanZ family protein